MGEYGSKVYRARWGRDQRSAIVIESTDAVKVTARLVCVERSAVSDFCATIPRDKADWTHEAAVRRLHEEADHDLTRAHAAYVLAAQRAEATKAWLAEHGSTP